MAETRGNPSRRNFIRSTTVLTGLTSFAMFPSLCDAHENVADQSLHVIGPREGYAPQIGTLVSMMEWMRATVLRSVTNMTTKDLDYLHDANSNTIGAMLMHLAAVDAFYQINTFEGRNDFNDKEKAVWGAGMELGDRGRKMIKGNDLNYYLEILKDTRNKTLSEFKKRDDKWLMTIDPHFFANQPTNNYCKWFHVCEHESNHNGQIKWIKGRLPGAKPSGE